MGRNVRLFSYANLINPAVGSGQEPLAAGKGRLPSTDFPDRIAKNERWKWTGKR